MQKAHIEQIGPPTRRQAVAAFLDVHGCDLELPDDREIDRGVLVIKMIPDRVVALDVPRFISILDDLDAGIFVCSVKGAARGPPPHDDPLATTTNSTEI